MRKRLKWPVAALLFGVLGAALRRWQISSAFEPELGLCDTGAPASWALVIFYLAAAGLLLLLARGTVVKERAEDERVSLWDAAFAAKGDTVYLVLMVLAGFLTIASAYFLASEAAQMMAVRRATGEGDSPLLQLLLAVCAVPGGAGLILSARSASRMTGRGRENIPLLLPVVLCCAWLLEAYRSNAADPVLWDYVPLLLTAVFGALFQMSCAEMAFDEGRPRRMLWLAGMTAVSGSVALATLPEPSALLLLGGQVLAALAALWLAPVHLAQPPDAGAFPLERDQDGGEQSVLDSE